MSRLAHVRGARSALSTHARTHRDAPRTHAHTGVKQYDTSRIISLALYGFAVSAPMSHYLFEFMNHVLGETSRCAAAAAAGVRVGSVR